MIKFWAYYNFLHRDTFV